MARSCVDYVFFCCGTDSNGIVFSFLFFASCHQLIKEKNKNSSHYGVISIQFIETFHEHGDELCIISQNGMTFLVKFFTIWLAFNCCTLTGLLTVYFCCCCWLFYFYTYNFFFIVDGLCNWRELTMYSMWITLKTHNTVSVCLNLLKIPLWRRNTMPLSYWGYCAPINRSDRLICCTICAGTPKMKWKNTIHYRWK